MRILVLAQEVGQNAPGILYERVLRALPSSVEWELYPVRYPRTKYWFRRLMVSLLGRDLMARFLCRGLRHIRPGAYDAVLSLCSNDRFWALEAGLYLQRRRGLPWACYFVDAIPAPEAWQGDSRYRRAIVRLLRRCAPRVSFLASLCPEMLAYQRDLMGEVLRTGVLLPAVPSAELVVLPPRPEGKYRFVYAGRLYGKRTAEYLLQAMDLLWAQVPQAELVLLGTDPVVNPGPRVTLLPWTADPAPYFAGATALINIDACVEHDVFLSSKLFSYLPYNRPVICETGEDSPARHLFAGVDSVLLCGHNAEELKNAMLQAIRAFDGFNYEDRLPLLQRASARNVAQELARELSLLKP